MPAFARAHRSKFRSILLSICIIAVLIAGLVSVKTCFPLRYHEQIQQWSELYDLESAWVAAVIRCESNFQHDAISSAGAIGLMQIMPETGLWIAQQLSWSDPASIQLTDAPTSIALGTWYLRHLLDRFGSQDAALMAYNAGPTRVDQWSKDREEAYPQTQQYVRRIHLVLPIYRAYFRVLWLVDLIPSVRVPY